MVRWFLLAAAIVGCWASRRARGAEVLDDGEEPVPTPPVDGVDPDPAPAPAPVPDVPIKTCNDIKDVVIRGKDWTNIVGTVCNFWPAQFGKFPASSVDNLKKIIGQVMNEGGLWDKLRALAVERSNKYCLRREVQRYELTSAASESTCPTVLSDDVLEEMPQETDLPSKKELLEGYWACENSTSGGCDCRKRDQLVDDDPTNDFPMVSIASRPSGCAMVHAGKCYGKCPQKFRPTFLKGWFRPVCTSICAETTYPVTCGVGCANTRSDCVSIILNQVKEVAISAGKVAIFFSGAGVSGVMLAQTVEQVVKVAEFAFNVLSKVLVIADAAYKDFTREQAELATLVSIFQVLKDLAAEIASDWIKFQDLIRKSGNLFLRLIDAEFAWKNVNLGWITGAIMKEGAAALFGAFEVARAFAYQKCEMADDEVHFTIEQIGDQRLIGAWSEDGSTNGKPRYRLIRDRGNTVLEWSRRSKSWAIWVFDASFGRGWWFGWAGLGWRELYETKANTPGFPSTGWRKIEGPLPMPLLVGTKTGGE